MKYCPRCKKNREEIYFEPPVKICLMCYASIKENQQIRSIEVLREKARNSRNARRWVTKEYGDWVQQAARHSPEFQRKQDETRDILKDAKDYCPRCKQLVSIDELEDIMVDGEARILCANCRNELLQSKVERGQVNSILNLIRGGKENKDVG